MNRFGYWVALFGSALVAVLALFGWQLAVLPQVVWGSVRVAEFSVSMIGFAVLLAFPAAVFASLMEPLCRIAISGPSWAALLAYLVGGALTGALLPFVIELLRSQDLSLYYPMNMRMTFGAFGAIGGALFFVVYARRQARA